MPQISLPCRHLDASVRIGLWKMTETEETLYSQYPELYHYKAEVGEMKSSSRRMEFLVVRTLLKEMLGHVPLLQHNADGKPFLSEGMNISISHTRGYVAVILSDTENVAVDIEYYSDRVCRVADKFIRKDENAYNLRDKILCWCSKETLYKLYSSDKLEFHEMRVDFSSLLVSGPGNGNFNIENLRRKNVLKMCFITTETYIMTYAHEKRV